MTKFHRMFIYIPSLAWRYTTRNLHSALSFEAKCFGAQHISTRMRHLHQNFENFFKNYFITKYSETHVRITGIILILINIHVLYIMGFKNEKKKKNIIT